MKEKLVNTLLVLSLLVTLSPKFTFCQEVVRIEIIDYGIYNAEITKTIQDNSHLSGHRKLGERFILTRQTENVPLKLGIIYGFRYKIVGLPDGTHVELTKEQTFPEMTNPTSGKKSSRDVTILKKTAGMTNFTGDVIDEVWQLVPGEHKITLYYNGKKLAEKSFYLMQ